jgi:Predicted metalloendopeptidase
MYSATRRQFPLMGNSKKRWKVDMIRLEIWQDKFRRKHFLPTLLYSVLVLSAIDVRAQTQTNTTLLDATAAATSSRVANPQEVDLSVRPGQDFYRFANGGWLKAAVLPSGHETLDIRSVLAERNSQRVRELIQNAATTRSFADTIAKKVGDYYASLMDQNAIEAKGLAAVAESLATISAVTDKTSLSAYLGTTLSGEIEGLTSNSDHIFGIWINQGFEDASHNLPHIWQGGLGLPSRDDYIDPAKPEVRSQYQKHIARVLKFAGVTNTESRAQGILSLETRIAQAFAPDSDAADVSKQNNSWKRSEFEVKAAGLDWNAYFQSAGLSEQQNFIVWQPSAITGVSALVRSETLDTWKDYLRFHQLEHYASVLPKEVADEHFAFYGVILAKEKETPARDKEAIAATESALGQMVGQLYTQRYFPPESKAKAEAMVADLITAYRARISNLDWMSPETKRKALAKLSALQVIVGYPDAWIDYSSLEIVRGDAFGNMQRVESFYRRRDLSRLKLPVVPIDWPINPQRPGAVIMFSPNAEFFTASILQPPYFDPDGDIASNYGSAGAAMAHEISHSFDELGNIYDAQGRLGDWWTSQDRAKYREAARKLAEQFDAYCPFTDLCVNGKQVLTENIADLTGLLVAHDAYMLSLRGKRDIVVGGFNGEQRFFLAFAQRWRKVQSEAALRRQIQSDTHAPSEYRSDTVRNVADWYDAFKVVNGEKLYLKPADRIRIW